MAVPMSSYDPAGPKVEMNWFGTAWTLFAKQWPVWVGAAVVEGFLNALFTFAVSVVTGIFTMYRTIFSALISGNSAALPKNTPYLPPYHSLGQYMAGVFVFAFACYALSIVLYGGMFRMAWEQIGGRKISVSDTVVGAGELLRLLALAVLTFIPFAVASMMCAVPAFVLAGVWMFAPLLIVVKGLGPLQALGESCQMLGKHWAMAGLYILAAAVVLQIGHAVVIFGSLVTTPIVIIATAVGMYRFVHWPPSVPGYASVPAGTWPPNPPQGAPGAAPYGQAPPYSQGQQPYGQSQVYGGGQPQQPYGQSQPPYGQSQPPQPPAGGKS